MKNEMEKKCAKYESIIESITSDIHQMKKKQRKTSEFLYTINATRLNFALPIGFNKTIEENSTNFKKANNDHDTILKRMQDIENKNSNLEKMIETANELIRSSISYNDCNTFNTKNNESTNENENYVSDLECINDELNKINVALFKSEEKISKTYAQIHVVSAKYIKFNEKISNFITKMNKQTIEINKSQIIDGDAVPFLEPKTLTARFHPKSDAQIHSSTKSIFSNIPGQSEQPSET